MNVSCSHWRKLWKLFHGNVTKSGARFNPDKAVWFNEQYLRSGDSSRWIEPLKERNAEAMQGWSGTKCQQVLDMMLERVQFLHEIGAHSYLFAAPDRFDEKLIRKNGSPKRRDICGI